MNPRLLRPTRSDPRRIDGLAAWWDASDGSTVTLNGSNVSEWRDKSGNSLHAKQDTAALQPAYGAAIYNGRRSIEFRTATVRFPLEFSPLSLGAYTLISVTEPSSANNSFLVGGDSGTHLTYGPSLNNAFYNYAGVFFQVSASRPTGLNIQSATRTSGGVHALAINGSNVTGSPTNNSTTATVKYLGGRFISGALVGIAVDACEILIYTRALTAGEIKSIERALAGKWGIAIA